MPTRPPTGPLAPSRTSTPTLLDLDHAPLRLAPSPSPGLSSSASLLGLAATPSCPPSPSSRSNLRRRRSVSPLPSSADAHHPPPSASTSCSSRPPSPPHSPHRHLHRVDSDVTRPSLRRVTNDALGVAALGTSGGGPPVDPADPDGYGLRRDSKGKGRALDYGGAGGRRAVSENGAANKEREVIVHKVRTRLAHCAVAQALVSILLTLLTAVLCPQVQKTDSYASISLQYGITVSREARSRFLHSRLPAPSRPSLTYPRVVPSHKRSALRTASGRPTPSTSARPSSSRSTSATSPRRPLASSASPARRTATSPCGNATARAVRIATRRRRG